MRIRLGLESPVAISAEIGGPQSGIQHGLRFVVGPGLLTKELLSPKDNNQLRFMILTLPPGATSDDVLTGPGDKAGYVLSGRVELAVGNAVAEIREGDSFQFESSIPHHLVNRSSEEAKLVWIIRIREAHL